MERVGRFWVRLLVGLIALLGGLFIAPGSEGLANAQSTTQIDQALQAYESNLQPVLEARERLDLARDDVSRARLDHARDSAAVAEALEVRRADRERFASVAVGAYMERGGRSATSVDDPQQGLALLSARLRTVQHRLDLAEETSTRSSIRLDDALEEERLLSVEAERAEAALRDPERVLTERIQEVIPNLPGYAFSAYRWAAASLVERDPTCRVAPAVLVGLGRMMSNHGRAMSSAMAPSGIVPNQLRGLVGTPIGDTDGGRLDGDEERDVRIGPLQLLPQQWYSEASDAEDDLDATDSLRLSSLIAGRFLCSTGFDLSTDDGLRRSLSSLTGDPTLARAIMGSARHAARATSLDLGPVPPDPRIEVAERSIIDSSATTGTGAADLLWWSRARLGTPYSQCLGPIARPEDPECPPGTNRFGVGFFDCSGFVSSAFAAIGVNLPTTTETMILDQSLADRLVREEYDPEDDRPGDILLMDGHVALSAGDGSVIHASGGQLTEEPLPNWIRNGILGIYRVL